MREVVMMLKAAKTLVVLTGCAGCMLAQAQGPGARPWEKDALYGGENGMNLDVGSQWRRDLEKSGVLSRTGPFRVALPLVSFGDKGPKLMFTYVPRMKDDAGSKVFMLFLRFNME
jgi:hypothetical protein